jgi:hypothetical protein
MSMVVSFSDARAAKVKATLSAYAASRSPAMVETGDELIDARRIFCRDAVAVLIDRYGYQTRVGYTDITDVSPVLPAADIIAMAEWEVIEQVSELITEPATSAEALEAGSEAAGSEADPEILAEPAGAVILPFPGPRS